MYDPKLIDTLSMGQTYYGKPVADVLRYFQIRVFRHRPSGNIQLSVDFCRQQLHLSPQLPAEHAFACIESLQVGLIFGHAAAGYVKKDGMWIPKEHVVS